MDAGTLSQALRYGTFGMPLNRISEDVLDAVCDVACDWGHDAASRLCGHGDHALFLRDPGGNA